MSAKENKQWKDALLKTSLPLEYIVAEKLRNLKCGIMGEYHYLRPNEQGVDTEFSIDIWAVHHMLKKNKDMWGHLNFLIECKYSHQSVKWLFTPHSKTDTEYFFEIGIVHALDHLCTRKIFDPRPLWRLNNNFPLCVKGVELHSKDATVQNIERGKSQLRYGIPRLAAHLFETQIMVMNDEDLNAELLCPILVTTASLYVVKDGLTLENFKKADNIKDISEEVPALILTNPYSHIYTNYVDNIISNLHDRNPEIRQRLKQLDDLLDKDPTEPKIPVTFDYNWFIREVSQRILVLNLDNFESIITKIRQATLKAGRSLNRIGILEIDANGLKRIKKIS